MLPVNYDARSTQRELDKLKREVDRVDALAVGPTGPAGPTGPQGAVGLQGPAGSFSGNIVGVNVKDYGAQCNANATNPTDDTQAIKNCLAQAPEGSTIYFPGSCLISDEIVVTRKLNLRGTGSAIATLKKASSFPNKPALTVGNGTDGLSGISVFDFMIDGNGQAGDGAKFQKLGSFTLMNFRSEDNKGWGMVRNGLWLSSMINVVLLGNGTAASGGTPTSGGGVLDSFSIRETSDLTCFNFNANFNHNHQMLWDDAVQNILGDGSEGVPYRMVGYYQLGGEYGTNQQTGLTNSVVAIRTADRSGFFGVKFNSATGTNVHDLEIGSPLNTLAAPLSDIDELSFDSCHTQKNHDNSNAFYGVKVNNRITSFSFTRQSHSGSEKFMDLSSVTSGDVYINDSETIPFQDIDDPNGIVNKDTISVTAFGVKADGVTDNKDTLQQAIDYAASVGKTLYFPSSGNFIKITRPVYVRSNSNWVGGGEIRNTTTSTGINGVCLMPGGFHPAYFGSYNSDIVTYTQYPINAVNSGNTITTTTAGDAANFAVGDLVWVTTTKTWVGSSGDYPVTAHLSEVLSANNTTGVIVLDIPISEAMGDLYGSLQVCNAQEAAVQDVRGNNMLLCKNAQINGISITSDQSAAMARGGMYKCDFNFKDIRAREAIFANAFVNTSVRAQTVTVTRKLCDIAAYSNQFSITIDSAVYDGSLAESNLPAFSRVGECSRNGSITVQNMNCSGYIDPDPLVMIDSGCRNVSQIHPNVVAPNHGEETGTGSAFRFQQGVSSKRQIYITANTWTGNTVFSLGDRILNGGAGYICKASGTSAATGGPTGTTTGVDITDGTVVWRYVTNVAAIGQTVLNYGTTFDSQGASRTGGLKVYLNNVLLSVGTGAGKYQITDSNTTITLGTALVAEDRVKIGATTDYQLTLEDCWMSVNAKLGGAAARGASISDAAQNANPPTVRNIKRCGFKSLNIDAPSTAFPETGQSVDLEGEHSYINNAQISTGELFVSSLADRANIQGFFADGARDLSSNSIIRISSDNGFQTTGIIRDIKSFGAIGDGVTDDTVAVKAAIDSGQLVYVPDGVFLVSSWPLGGVLTASTLKMRGTGTIKAVGNTKVFVVIKNDADIKDVQFEGFKFVFENSFSSSASFDKFHLDNITVKNCGGGITLERPVNSFKVTNCLFENITANKPIRVGQNTYSAQDTWRNLSVSNNTFRNISTVSGTDCNAVLIYGKQVAITGNTFDTIGAVGTFETFSGDGSDTTFTVTESGLNEGQCTVYVNDVEQINTDETTLWNLNGTTLTFTTAPASGTNNIKFYYAGESAAIYTKARFATITGNSISGMGKLPNGTTTLNVNQIYGINVKGRGRGDTEKPNGFNVAVTGNTLEGVNGLGSGIRIQNDCVNVTGNNVERFRWGINGNTAVHDDSNISNNNIYHCSQYGINFIQSGTNAIMQGNNITGVDVGSGVYEPLIAIHVRAHSDTENYNISNNSISGCKKGIKISSSSTAGAEISNVLITNNTLSNVTGNGVEFADCNTITVDNNHYKGEVTNQFIRPVSPNQNVTIRDSRTKSYNTGAAVTLQTFNTSVVDQAVRVTASVTAKQGDAEFAAYKITGLFKVSRETVDGVVVITLAQVGSTATEYAITSSGAASWGGASFLSFEGDLLIRVQGTAATPATVWSAKTEYVSTTDASF